MKHTGADDTQRPIQTHKNAEMNRFPDPLRNEHTERQIEKTKTGEIYGKKTRYAIPMENKS